MNVQLLSSIAAEGLSTLLLLLVFVIARNADTSRFSSYWIGGWALYELRIVFEFADAAFPGTHAFPALMLGFAGASAIYLLAGSLTLSKGRSYRIEAIAASLVMGIGVAVGTMAGTPRADLTLAVFFVLGLVQIYTGVVFIMLHRRQGSVGALFGGIAMAVWGLHKWDYPFLRPLDWFAPIGYQMGVFFQTATGVAVAVMLYEQARIASERESGRYRSLFDSLTDCVYVSDFKDGVAGRFLEVNDVAVATLGYSREEFSRMTIADLDVDDTGTDREADMEALRRGERKVFRRVQRTKNGRAIPFEVNTKRFELDGQPVLVGIARNIALREIDEGRLREALSQKELLLREIHHRVKNNLQIVSSLLTLREPLMRDPADAQSLAGIQARISSMALVHEMLYRDPSVAAVPMGSYLRELAREIVSSWAIDSKVSLDFLVEDLAYPIDRAIPVGLIVSELAMNACKHAFKGREGGNISLSLSREGATEVLVVGDDGIGMPACIEEDCLGLELVRVLAGQLRGSVERDEAPGTIWRLVMPRS
ncbi:MAG TPA: histidine kinase dimerization/phosphoacceptor domain -containing protein [Rectinemataceae bacterium]|nr:histidine kinase dimerization/phosphoacceptor domain -containing protein [Rectinemataceae bacterium]